VNAAEHYDRSSQLISELDSDQVESFAGSRQIVALAALTHAVLAIAAEAGVPQAQVRDAQPAVCLTCGFSETSHSADSGPQGTGCDGSGPWAPAASPAARSAAQAAGQ
jgi:hypothetical protein